MLNTHQAAFRYNVTMDYGADQSVAIGSIIVICLLGLEILKRNFWIMLRKRQIKIGAIASSARAITLIGSWNTKTCQRFPDTNLEIQQLLPNLEGLMWCRSILCPFPRWHAAQPSFSPFDTSTQHTFTLFNTSTQHVYSTITLLSLI